MITVGASDDNGTANLSDDKLPTWSSVGPTPDTLAKPDLVAPGRKIVSVRVPGSTLDLLSPTHREGPTTIRFSGTSEAAAVAAYSEGGVGPEDAAAAREAVPEGSKAAMRAVTSVRPRKLGE